MNAKVFNTVTDTRLNARMSLDEYNLWVYYEYNKVNLSFVKSGKFDDTVLNSLCAIGNQTVRFGPILKAQLRQIPMKMEFFH